jgi:hypothetical protein
VIKNGHDAAVSEIIGTILMLGMAIALFAGVSLLITSYPLSTPSPQVDLVGFIEGSDIVFEHHGGPSLLGDTELGITINGSTNIITVEEYIHDNNQNDRWDIGEQVIYTTSGLGRTQVDVMVIDSLSNSVLMMATIQENGGGSSTTPSLSTTVIPLTFYLQTSSPVNLIASGDSDLDSITLYYRWSNDNWTESWTLVTYDIFENGFGNYTDGGSDCLIYSGGSYAHQGINAINIRDNSDNASSFYSTSGIDVNTPGYTSILIDFWFITQGMGPNYDFWMQYYDGSDWQIIADYDYNVDFIDDQFYHEFIWINETDYTFPSDMQINFQCDAQNNNNNVYIDEIYVNTTTYNSNWKQWNNPSNPDGNIPWNWDFNFPNGQGYYEFFSIGLSDGLFESTPIMADARCYYNP